MTSVAKTSGSFHPACFWSEMSPLAVTVHSPVIPLLSKHKKHRHHTETCPVSTGKLHHSSTRFFRMISRTSAVTSFRMLSMGSSVRQNRTTFPSGFTRNFQKFHFGIFCTESETQHTTRYTCTRLSAINLVNISGEMYSSIVLSTTSRCLCFTAMQLNTSAPRQSSDSFSYELLFFPVQ